MRARVLAFVLGCLAFVATARAGTTRSDLMFEVTTAIKQHDRAALVSCFNFKGTDDATKQSIDTMIGQILTWPTFTVTTSERAEKGPAKIVQDGRAYTINGDWTFQIHILRAKPSTGGFVFPAGMTPDGRCAILLTVPAK
jgi:hypothetical protein